MTDPFQVIDATWPAASIRLAGGFCVREGRGGGSRVSSASLAAPWETANLAAAIAAQCDLGQTPIFMVKPGQEALDTALDTMGFETFDPVVIYAAPIDTLPHDVPPVTAFAHWPPLAIARAVWAETGIGPARQAVMDRACGPKAVVLGRRQDRAAGAAFVALHQGTAMVHALSVLPDLRRGGLGRAMMAEATRWAGENGATQLALVVTRANRAGNALYQSLGMTEVCGYHYRRKAQR